MERRVRLAIGVFGLTVAGCGSSDPTQPTNPSPTPPVSSPSPAHPSPAIVNQAPSLELRITPSRIRGRSPLEVRVDMCRSADVDGEPLQFAFEWAGEGKRLGVECSATRTYDRPTRSVAYFCVWDGHPEHLVCRMFEVDVS
jgi:hypothetical protein